MFELMLDDVLRFCIDCVYVNVPIVRTHKAVHISFIKCYIVD